MRWTRREILRAFGLSATAAAAGCTPAPGDLGPLGGRPPDPDHPWGGDAEPDDAAFPAGVQSGDPAPDALMLWTRYRGDAPLEARLATWGPEGWVSWGVLGAPVADGGYVHLRVTGLPVDTPVAFRFVDADGRGSPVGGARTTLGAGDFGLVRFGATSCLSLGHVDFPSLPATLGRGPLDAWLWLGDTVYNDAQITLPDYRANWQRALSTSGFRAVTSAVPGIHTWDDHEVVNDHLYHDIDLARQQAAFQAFFENIPTLPRQRPLWRSLRFGRTAEVFVLDCRSERIPDQGQYISPEQMSWLKRGLRQSPCTWKVVLDSVPIAQLPYDIPQVLNDRWEGYPAQRTELLDHLVDMGTRGVVFVSGDLHQGTVTRLEAEGPLRDVWEFLVGPGGSRRNPLAPVLVDGDKVPWSDAVWSCTRFDLHPAGLLQVTYVGEADETWLHAWFDDHGRLIEYDHLPLSNE